MITVDEVRRQLLSLLPPGALDLYDTSDTGDVFLLFDSAAEVIKAYGYDLLDTLRREIFPSTAVQKIPDWEGTLGLSNEFPALFGDIAQRQSGVVSKIRESGAFCDPVVSSVIGPLLGYFPSTPVEIIKADRGVLTLLHSYGWAFDVPIPHGIGITSIPIQVIDGGGVSLAGVQLELNLARNDLTGWTISLIAPDGVSAAAWSFSGPVNIPMKLYWANGRAAGYEASAAGTKLTGSPVAGVWRLEISNPGAVDNTLLSGPWLFVEGIGRRGIGERSRVGGEIFDWGIYADPAHLGESGTAPNFQSARRAIRRMKHTHTVGSLIQSLEPWPDTDTGPHAAVPDECLPT